MIHGTDGAERFRPQSHRPRMLLVVAAIATLAGLTELGVRMAGLLDFPIYQRDSYFGYVPRPNQAGWFLQQNQWMFNDRSMGVDKPWNPSWRTDILLVGNSIVLGGNPYDHKDKLAPLIQAQLRSSCAVWPVAAGGWTNVNEFRFLERHADIVAGTDFFLWEYMAHQMGSLNPWNRETAHPTARPTWATGYVVRKALDQRFPSTPRFVLREPAQAAQNYAQFDAMLKRMVEASGRKPAGIIFLYPDQQQLTVSRSGAEWLPDRAEIERLAARYGIVLIDIAGFSQWTATMYKDGIHPTREGNAVLSSILSNAVRRHQSNC